MNQRDRLNLASTANGILLLWKGLIDEGKVEVLDAHQRCWYRRAEMQAFQDTLNCMVFNGLIEDYDVVDLRVKINGQWMDNIKRIKP